MNGSQNPTTRRDFLKTAGALAALTPAARSFPRILKRIPPSRHPVLVAVFQRGGADFLNMVLPYKDATYHAVRPTIGLGKEDGVIPLDGIFGLHPALEPLYDLYERKIFAPVVNLGSPHPTRSHFDAQDFMERAAPGIKSVQSGWLNRFLEATPTEGPSAFRALGMQGLLPRSLRGPYPVLAVPQHLDRRRGVTTLDRFEDFYEGGMPGPDAGKSRGAGRMKPRKEEPGEEVVESGQLTIETLRRFQEIMDRGKETVASAGYPASPFGKRMQAIARVIRADAGLEVAAVDYDGWDHHVQEGGLDGRQAAMLSDLAASLAAFARDLQDRMDDVLVLTMTEFGRTVRENGNRGTDHGRGGGMFLIGGGVQGGKVHGAWRGLSDNVLVEGRDLPVTTDFRDVFAACLRRQFDFKAPKDFFPGYRPKSLRLF